MPFSRPTDRYTRNRLEGSPSTTGDPGYPESTGLRTARPRDRKIDHSPERRLVAAILVLMVVVIGLAAGPLSFASQADKNDAPPTSDRATEAPADTLSEASLAASPTEMTAASTNPSSPPSANPTALTVSVVAASTPAMASPPTSAPAAQAPSVPPSTTAAQAKRVGIQAGHWKATEHAEELQVLRKSTGSDVKGVREVDVNLDIAKRVVAILKQRGITADLLPATVPVAYKADAFVALHCDANEITRLTGWKLARSRWSTIPKKDDALLAAISATYATTGLPREKTITDSMLEYYAFNNQRYQHAVSPTTAAVIVEMGFLTNDSDRRFLTTKPDSAADGIVRGILNYLAK